MLQCDSCAQEWTIKHRTITPSDPNRVRAVFFSCRLSRDGWDREVRAAIKTTFNVDGAIMDARVFDARPFASAHHAAVIVAPNSFAISRTIECFQIPETYLRSALENQPMRVADSHANGTPFEPERGGFGFAGDLQHHPATGQGLSQRSATPELVLAPT